MTLDLAQFHDSFFEESFEALDGMEAALLKLSEGVVDIELINTVFRVAHSIKGGSATFGFSDVAAFTHTLETLLDQLRSGKRTVDQNIVDVLLRSVDVMRELLAATQQQQPADAARVGALHGELEAIMNAAAKPASAGVEGVGKSSGIADNSSVPLPAISGTTTPGWRMRFAPGPELLQHGNDPLVLLRELEKLGPMTVRVEAGRVPTLSELDPEVCVLAWNIVLDGSIERSAVQQVFEWAEGECELILEPLTAGQEAAAAASSASLPERAAPAEAEKPAHERPKQEATPGEVSRAGGGDGGSIRVSIEKIDELLNSVGELVITQSVLSQLASSLEGREAVELRAALVQLERHMRALQESVMRVRMLPISFVFNRFPRMIRDLGQRLGKKLDLRLSGEQTELDKTVLEKIGDPLVHLVRNSVDHGIESPERRRAAGKPEQGTIHLHAYHKGGNVIVEVTDDGAGLNTERILAKARERGLVGVDEELSEERIFNLIFQPGFSTADVVSDVSGRGVGMDVVRRNINELGGHVQIFSALGQGSTVRIRLPLTLAILDGQLARVGAEMYVVPIVSIVETIQMRSEQISSIANCAQLFRLRDNYIPIVRIHELFCIEPQHTNLLDGLLMIVEADGQRAGLFVDELMSQQQVVIKSLETNFRQVPGLAGATMLGDGRVALILDVPGLIGRFQTQEARRDAARQVA